MGNTNSQTIDVATGNDKQLTCNALITQDDCNKQPNCIFLNGCQTLLISKYLPIINIPSTDIISGIEDIVNQPETYKLFLMINNKANTTLLKSISIDLQNCNNISSSFANKYYLHPQCNLFLSDQQEGEFSLKNNKIIHSFNPITSQITPEVFINQAQLDIIKENEYKIKLIDIYNNEVTIPILSYPTANATSKQSFSKIIMNLNKSNLENATTIIQSITTN